MTGIIDIETGYLTVHGILQGFAGLKLWLIRSRDLDGFTSPGVPALRCLAMANAERAEPNKSYFASPGKCACNCVNNAVNRVGGISFVHSCYAGNARYEFVFIHLPPPISNGNPQEIGLCFRARSV